MKIFWYSAVPTRANRSHHTEKEIIRDKERERERESMNLDDSELMIQSFVTREWYL